MISDLSDKQSQNSESDAIQRAIEYGVDISLLKENLRLEPTERMRQAQATLDSALSFRAQVESFRAKRG